MLNAIEATKPHFNFRLEMEGDKERGVKDNENYEKTSTHCISLCL